VDAAQIIGIGENEGAAIMTAALLKQIGVRIVCRIKLAASKVLEAMNIENLFTLKLHQLKKTGTNLIFRE